MTELAITYRDPRELKPAVRNARVFDGKQGTWSQEICPSCFTQFDLDDDDRSYVELRARWLSRQAPWSSRRPKPNRFDPLAQLEAAGLLTKVHTDASGWTGYFRDRDSRAIWEVTYPQGEMHGGGPRHFARVEEIP
jgi:hypothetical protein